RSMTATCSIPRRVSGAWRRAPPPTRPKPRSTPTAPPSCWSSAWTRGFTICSIPSTTAWPMTPCWPRYARTRGLATCSALGRRADRRPSSVSAGGRVDGEDPPQDEEPLYCRAEEVDFLGLPQLAPFLPFLAKIALVTHCV